jgi:hypothetical protein
VLLAVLLFCLQFAVSINEREWWGPRIARTVPRNPLLRAGAFLLYSGSGGGVLFSAAGAGLTLLAGEAWVRYYPAMRAAGDWQGWARMVGAVALYTACYGLTAVAVRHYLGGGRLRPAFTWVVAMVLVGVCSAGPALAAYFLYYRDWAQHATERWWVLPNPFASLIEMTELRRRVSPAGDYPQQVLAFTGTWAAAAALVCLPWFVRQALRFRPTARGAAAAAPSDNHRQERGHAAVLGRG